MRQSWRRISAATHAGSRRESLRPNGMHGHRRRERGEARAAREAEHPRLVREARRRDRDEPGRGRAEHETRDEVAVPAPQQLRDRSAHRVADRDDRAGVELDEGRRAVVGAVREPEDAARAHAARVPAQVGRDDPEVLRRAVRTPGTSSGRHSRPSRAGAAASARRAGPASSRTNVVPRRGSSRRRPGGRDGIGHERRYAMQSTR